MKNKIVSTIAVILVATIILSSSLSFVKAEDNETENTEESNTTVNTLSLNEQKEQVEENLEEAEAQLEYVEEELSETIVAIQKLEDQISEYQEQLDEVNAQYEELEAKVEEIEAQLEVAQAEYDKQFNSFSKKLLLLYKKGDTTYLDVLLNSKNIIEFISNYFLIEQLTSYDSKIIENLQKQKEEIEAINRELQEQKANLKVLKIQAEKQTTVLTNTKTVYENQKNSLTDSEAELNSQIETYKKQQEELENLIQNAIDESIYELQYSGGVMIWPTLATSYITSAFGSRVHPIQGVVKNHDGIDIGGSTGDPVYAAADGIVIYSAYNTGGYGNMVMIDHGLNSEGVKIVTLYGHGNKLLVEVGDTVKQGDVIMEMGSTGNSTGPHVHFEVRENGVAVDPKKYLSSEE